MGIGKSVVDFFVNFGHKDVTLIQSLQLEQLGWEFIALVFTILCFAATFGWAIWMAKNEDKHK